MLRCNLSLWAALWCESHSFACRCVVFVGENQIVIKCKTKPRNINQNTHWQCFCSILLVNNTSLVSSGQNQQSSTCNTMSLVPEQLLIPYIMLRMHDHLHASMASVFLPLASLPDISYLTIRKRHFGSLHPPKLYTHISINRVQRCLSLFPGQRWVGLAVEDLWQRLPALQVVRLDLQHK